jgi:NDP-sugar pyrophosphorylase family protein
MIDRTTITALVLAGGLGTRLRSTVADCPKVLAPVGGRPFLTHLLDQLADAGFREAILLTGYQADRVRDTFGESYGSMRLLYSVEPSPLGTGGAVRHALPDVSGSTILLLNGDSYCDVDWEAFLRFHHRRAADLSLVVTRVTDTSRYGAVQLAGNERVLGWAEKSAWAGEGWINAGIYLMARALVEEIPRDGPVSLERQMFPSWLTNHNCFAYRSGGRFLDIGTPESYRAAEAFFAPMCVERPNKSCRVRNH